MATKKKSKVIESAEVAEMVNMPTGGWPRIEQGSHLTVIYHEDGKSELKWDDEALRNEVNAAILSVEKKTMVITAEDSKNIVASPAYPKRKKKGS
jgi:hypothetical protein